MEDYDIIRYQFNKITLSDERGCGRGGQPKRENGGVRTSPGKGKRVHLALPSAVYEILKEVQGETNADTLVEVVKAALLTYLALVKEHKEGKRFFVEDTRGDKTYYALFVSRH